MADNTATKSLGAFARFFSRCLRYGKKTLVGLKPVTQKLWFALLAVALVLASQLTLMNKPIVGVYINAAALAILVGLGLYLEKLRDTAIAVAIIPTALMITLTLPQSTIFAESVVYYDAILILALIYRFIFTIDFPLNYTRLNPRGYAISLPLMLLIGEVLGVIGYAMLRSHYNFGAASLPLVAATSVVFALAEETLFRGLIQQRASQVMQPIIAGLMTVMIYTFVSIGFTASVINPLFALLLGSTLSFIYYKKQNLLLTFTVNALTKLTYVGLMAAFYFH